MKIRPFIRLARTPPILPLFNVIYRKTADDLFIHETAIQSLRRRDELSECFKNQNEIVNNDHSNEKQYASKA